MSRIVQLQTNFAVGEIDPLLRARIDLKQYYNALQTARNVVIQPQGGAKRREGLRYITSLDSGAANGVRLIPFEFNSDDSYMFAITPGKLYVFRDRALITNINSSGNNYLAISEITAAMLPQLKFAQSADTIIFVHEDLEPLQLVRGANNATWTKSNVAFTERPYYAYTLSNSNPSAQITPDSTSGNIKVTANGSVFASGNVHQYINITSSFGRLRIVEFVSATVVKTVAETPLFNTDAIAAGGWQLEAGHELAWSNSRGWPKAVTFHEGRLWLAGSKSLPSTIWASRVNDFFNFDKGEGLDDAALEATLSTSTLNSVTAIFSGRDLQIFTTGGEFYVPQGLQEPITPANFIVKIATRNGSKADVPIVGVDSGTLFIQRKGKSLNELAFTDSELAYNTNNVSMLSGHLFKSPIDMAIRRATSTDESDRLMIVNSTDGSMLVFSLLRSQEVTAPAEFTTDGDFEAVGVDIDTIYTVVKRDVGPLTNATVTVTDYANIAVGTKLTFTKNDGTVITLQFEAAGASSASAASGNTHFVRANASNNATADNVYTALNAVSGLTVANPAANVVTVARDDPGINNLTVTTTDSTRLAVTNYLTPSQYFVEYFDNTLLLDSAVQSTGVASSASAAHLDDKVLKIILDGIIHPDKTVTSNAVAFDRASVTGFEVGLNYEVEIKTMPVEPQIQSGSLRGFKKRILEVNAEVFETQALTINGELVSFRQFGQNNLDAAVTPFTGIKTIGPLLGFDKEGAITLKQTVPLAMTVLALDFKISVGQ